MYSLRTSPLTSARSSSVLSAPQYLSPGILKAFEKLAMTLTGKKKKKLLLVGPQEEETLGPLPRSQRRDNFFPGGETVLIGVIKLELIFLGFSGPPTARNARCEFF